MNCLHLTTCLRHMKVCRELSATTTHQHINRAVIQKWNIHSSVWFRYEPIWGWWLHFHFHLCSLTSISSCELTAAPGGEIFLNLEDLWLHFGAWDLAEASWSHRKGQVRRLDFIGEIICQRQFTSELLPLWLLISEDVPDEISAQEEIEASTRELMENSEAWFLIQASEFSIKNWFKFDWTFGVFRCTDLLCPSPVLVLCCFSNCNCIYS